MTLLEQFPSRRALVALTVIGLIGVILLRFPFASSGREMQAAGGYGIVAYELAFTPSQANAILTAWGVEGRQAALFSLLIDFAFMPAYAMLFSGLTLLLARALPRAPAAVGRWLAVGQWAAALLDALENIMLLRMLGGGEPVSAGQPLVAGIAASLKFALLAAALIYWVVGALIWLINRPTAKGRLR